MHFEEKIELLKQQFPSSDFKIPFTKASYILKSIEEKFIKYKDATTEWSNLDQYHSQWPDNIKNKIKIQSVNAAELYSIVNLLNKESNYWVVLYFKGTGFKHLVYDCKPAAILSLVSMFCHHCGFFIVAKQYTWLVFFQFDAKSNDSAITVYRSGEHLTPFDYY